MKKIFKHIKRKEGLTALIIVLVITALSVITAVALATIGVSEVKTSFDQTESGYVRASVDGCVEEALRLLSENSSYTGSAFSLFDTSCTITVASGTGTKTISATGVMDSYTREVEVEVDDSTLEITSWVEMTN